MIQSVYIIHKSGLCLVSRVYHGTAERPDLYGGYLSAISEFHCYRMSQSNLAGKKTPPLPRSDIALWTEYSVGDTQLAHQIHDTISLSLGDRLKTLEAYSRFSQLTLKSTILRLIKSRIDYLSSI